MVCWHLKSLLLSLIIYCIVLFCFQVKLIDKLLSNEKQAQMTSAVNCYRKYLGMWKSISPHLLSYLGVVLNFRRHLWSPIEISSSTYYKIKHNNWLSSFQFVMSCHWCWSQSCPRFSPSSLFVGYRNPLSSMSAMSHSLHRPSQIHHFHQDQVSSFVHSLIPIIYGTHLFICVSMH